MTEHSFGSQWWYRPENPRFRDYPFDLEGAGLPDLDGSLKAIGEYQRRLWANRKKALLLIVQGPDTSGKDSLIRTLATYMDPAGFHAWSFGRPQGEEARHDFLWRIMRMLPAWGEMVAFNRSHYEGVMAERIWPVHSPEQYNWQARFRAIREFEQHLLHEGTVLIKVWLNLSEDEHRKRLLKRLDKPRKRWKFDASDIDGWKRRREYNVMAEEAIAATHSPEAPWMIVPADCKPQARAIVARIVADQLEWMAPEYPAEDKEVLNHYRDLLVEKQPD